MSYLLDELWSLVLGEEGLLICLRCENKLDEELFRKITRNLNVLVEEWKKEEFIPKKALIIVSELVEVLAAGNRFLDDKEALKVEDASVELRDILNELY